MKRSFDNTFKHNFYEEVFGQKKLLTIINVIQNCCKKLQNWQIVVVPIIVAILSLWCSIEFDCSTLLFQKEEATSMTRFRVAY